MNTRLIDEAISHAIGGGWGDEEAFEGSEPIQVLRGADFPSAYLQSMDGTPLRYETKSKVTTRQLRVGDIVLEISGGTKDRPTGRTVFVTEQLLGDASVGVIPASFCRLVRIDPEIAEPRFIYYVLQDLYAQGGTWAFQNQSTGLSNFQFSLFRQEFGYPDFPVNEQRAIAEVLGALDDKIAANTRLVSTLLQLADAHFVGAAAHSVLSDLTFSDVADVGGGGTPKTKVEEYWGDEIYWATPTDVTALHGPYLSATSRRITQAGLDNCSSVLYRPGSILMTSRATIGAFAVAQSAMAVNQGFIVVNSKCEVPQWWLFHEMQRRVPEFVSHANGATFLELSRGKFKKFRVHLAANDIMQSFADMADALHKRAAAAERESASLASTRDALLPLLMSGTVTVKDAESVVEGVV